MQSPSNIRPTSRTLNRAAAATPVLTAAAATGIDGVPGEHYDVAETDGDLATKAIACLRDPARAAVMTARAGAIEDELMAALERWTALSA